MKIKNKGFKNTIKQVEVPNSYGKDFFYFYYLPCLNPELSETFGGIIAMDKKAEIGDILTTWNFPVKIVWVGNCEPKKEPDLNAVPMLRVVPIKE